MIRIEKPSEKPEILLNKGTERTRRDKADYDNDSDGYCSGKQKFEIKDRIYRSKSVKGVLLNAQHGKCCYCEAKFGATSPGNVEHYRPKRAVKQARGSGEKYPGYYWLAYDWDNLLVSCTVCNGNKSSLFPLVDEATRACSHHDDIEKEQPLFINPARDDPRCHIRFHREEPIHITNLGKETINSLGLRRDHLQEDRRERLSLLTALRTLVVTKGNSNDPSMKDLVHGAKDQLKAAIRSDAKFSSMAQDFLG